MLGGRIMEKLRIGNLVKHKDWGNVEVYGLNPDGVEVLYLDSVYSCNWSEVQELPLNKENLKLFKGVQEISEGEYNVDNFLLLKLEDLDWNDICFDVFMKDVYLTYILTVSELQNLYLDLARNKLE